MRIDNLGIVNCDSVGKPKDGDQRAWFALLEADGAGLPAEFADTLVLAA